jgi:6-pyruvoyl-tetrahydropterin synthase related domain
MSEIQKKQSDLQPSTKVCHLLILAVSVLFVLPIVLNGIPLSNDLRQHYQFAASIYNSMVSGEFFPNWSAFENNGYGGIGLRFYPPISYYVLSFGKIITGSWFYGSCAAFGFWAWLGAIGVFKSSLIAAVLFIFIPFHVSEIYASFVYAEFAGSSILPFCFLFVTRISKSRNLLNIVGLAVSYAVLVLTHLPLTVIGSICIFVFACFSIRRNLRGFIGFSTAILIGLLLSSFHWIRVVTEMKLLNHISDKFSASGQGNYDFYANFPLSFPYLSGLDNDLNSIWFIDLILFATLVVSLPSLFIFLKNETSAIKSTLYPHIATFVCVLFLATKLSIPLWEHISVLQKVQFPWRFLSVISVISVMFAASGIKYCFENLKTSQRSTAFLIFACLAFGIVFSWTQVIRQTNFLDQNIFAEIIADAPTAENNECWFPIWAEKGFDKINEKVVAGNRNAEIISWQNQTKIVKIGSGEATEVRLAVLNYPHWKATVNNVSTSTLTTSDGVVLIPVSAEESIIKLEFIEPAIVKIANLISKISWILLTFTALFLLWKTSLKSKI